MNRRIIRPLTLLLALLLISVCAAEDALPDGVYVPDGFTCSGGSGRVTIACPRIEAAGGEITATLVFSSPNYPRVRVKGV